MSFDTNEQGGAENQATEGEGAADLAGMLSGGGDAEFVTGTDKKPMSRTNVLLFGALLAVGAGAYFLFLKPAPESAAAAPTKDAEAAKKTITQFLDGGPQNIKKMEEMLKNTEKVVQQFLAYPSASQVPLSDLKTNPFRSLKSQDTGNGDDAAAAKRREEERQAVLKAVGALQLQSVMHSGNRSACMINNTLYQEGQQVDGFTIEKINPAAVIVKNGVYRFELKMQK